MKKLNIFMETIEKNGIVEERNLMYMLSDFIEKENLSYNMISKIYVGEKGYTNKCLTINFKEASLMIMFKRNILKNFKIVVVK